MGCGGEEFGETGLLQTEFKGGEFAWEKLDDCEGRWGWEKEGVNTVDDTICAKL